MKKNRKEPTIKTVKHQVVSFNGGKSKLEAKFDLKSPYVFNVTSYLHFQSEEEDVKRIISSVTNRFKTYIRHNLGCRKNIIVFDLPMDIEVGSIFSLTVEYAGLSEERMTKQLLLDKGKRMATLLEEMTRTLNYHWIRLAQTKKGNRNKREE